MKYKGKQNQWNQNQDKNYISLQFYNKDQIMISGPFEVFTQELKQLLKQQGSFYSPADRGWVLPFKDYKEKINKIKKEFSELEIKDIPILTFKALQPSPESIQVFRNGVLTKIQYSTNERNKNISMLPQELQKQLYEFQKEGVDFGIKKCGRVLIADEMGVGKTIQAIALAYLYKETWPILIVTPSSLKLSWRDEILKWLPVINKTKIQVVKDSESIFNRDASIFIVSYDLCHRIQEKIKSQNFQIAIADEVHYLKNTQAKRTEILGPILQSCKHVILLSGTPAMNKPKELFTILTILRPNVFQYFQQFGLRYCDPKPNPFSHGLIFDGATNTKELHYILQSQYMVRRLKKDVLQELPDKRRQKVQIAVDQKIVKEIQNTLSSMSQKGYSIDQYMDNLVDRRQLNEIDAQHIIRKANDEGKMRVFDAFTKCYILTGRAKLPGIMSYLKDMVLNEVKFIIYAHHIEVLDAIENEVKNLKTKYIRIDGSTNNEQRYLNIKKFQEETTCQVAILSLTASSLGLTLTATSTIIFAEMSWTPATLLQAEDRAHRIGQKECVNCHYLHGDNTLDNKLYDKLERKLSLITNIIDGSQTFQDLDIEQMEPGQKGKVNQTNKKSVQKNIITNYFPKSVISHEDSIQYKKNEILISQHNSQNSSTKHFNIINKNQYNNDQDYVEFEQQNNEQSYIQQKNNYIQQKIDNKIQVDIYQKNQNYISKNEKKLETYDLDSDEYNDIILQEQEQKEKEYYNRLKDENYYEKYQKRQQKIDKYVESDGSQEYEPPEDSSNSSVFSSSSDEEQMVYKKTKLK